MRLLLAIWLALLSSVAAAQINEGSAPIILNNPPAVAAAGAPTDATYITQTANGSLSAEQALGSLATGLVKNTTTTGVLSIVVPAAGIETWLATPSSANLLAAITDETGTGASVFANTPTLVTPVLGAATATSVTASGKLEAGSASTLGISTDVLLNRDGANDLALRNGTTAQAFRIYNTFTNASTYERGNFVWSANSFFMGTSASGGTQRPVLLDGQTVTLQTGATSRWQVNAAGHLLAVTDNVSDIGASGATRPRNIFMSGALTAGGAASINGVQIGSTALTIGGGELGFVRTAASGTAPGATGVKIGAVCGTNAGTAKLIVYAGTSTTPVTLLDNIGSGLSGC